MSSGLWLSVIVAVGLIGGLLTTARWSAVWALVGLAVAFLIGSLSWGRIHGLQLVAILVLEGGQVSQLVVPGYICAVAGLTTVVRKIVARAYAT
jgi:hypothetical protein